MGWGYDIFCFPQANFSQTNPKGHAVKIGILEAMQRANGNPKGSGIYFFNFVKIHRLQNSFFWAKPSHRGQDSKS
jgi:hypothetical protein